MINDTLSFVNVESNMTIRKIIAILLGAVVFFVIFIFALSKLDDSSKKMSIVKKNEQYIVNADFIGIGSTISAEFVIDNIKVEEVSVWIDGTEMKDDRVDNVVYYKENGKYYKRIFDGPVKAKWFGAIGDGIQDDTDALQKILDSDYPNIALDEGKTYLVTKNYTLQGFPNNDQPCLLIRDKSSLVLDGNKSKIIVKQHAQGILEIQKSNTVIVKNLTVIGAGEFPPIDGETGYGEKGIKGKGYHTSGFWGYYKNNSKNTAMEYRGGFKGKYQQYRGHNRTAPTWGEWNGGFIGNVSYGILIHNGCKDIILENCKAENFNYVGLAVGHNGDFYPKDLQYQQSTNVVFRNCQSNNNYSAGFHSMDVDGFKLVNSKADNSGHPDATPAHAANDPGYGYTARGSFRYTKNAVIENSIFTNNKRKGLDVHAGKSITFRGNSIANSNACGIFAAWTNASQPAIDIFIINNRVENCGMGNGSLGAIYVGASASTAESEKYLNAIVRGNTISNYSGSAIRARYGNTIVISDNIINNSIKGYGPNLSAILVMGQNGQALAHSVDVLNNRIKDNNGNIKRGIQVSNARDVNVEGNEMIYGADIESALLVTGGKNVYVNQNKVSLSGKGIEESVPEAVRSSSKLVTEAQSLMNTR